MLLCSSEQLIVSQSTNKSPYFIASDVKLLIHKTSPIDPVLKAVNAFHSFSSYLSKISFFVQNFQL